MVIIWFRIFITKILLFILPNLLSYAIGGRHSITDIPCVYYTTQSEYLQSKI